MQRVPDPNTSIRVFYSYAHEDAKYQRKIDRQLSILKKQGFITAFNHRDILPGQEWRDEIKKELKSADIILLLVSPDFMASDYHDTEEMQFALQRYEAKEVHIIPIILRPCEWEHSPLSKFKVLPDKGTPVTYWSPQDTAYLNIAQGIRKVVANIRRKKSRNLATLHTEHPIEYPSTPKPSLRKNTSLNKMFLDTAEDIGAILPDIRDLVVNNFSFHEIENRAKGFSLILLVFFTIIDVIGLPYSFFQWLNLAFLFPFTIFGLLFLIGITNKKGTIAYFVTSIFAFVWFFIGTKYIISNYHLSLPLFWSILILTSFLQLILFYPHNRRGGFRRTI